MASHTPAEFRKLFNQQVRDQKALTGQPDVFIRRMMIMDVFLRRFGLISIEVKERHDFQIVLKGGFALVKRYGLELGTRQTKDIDMVVAKISPNWVQQTSEDGKVLRQVAERILALACDAGKEDGFVFTSNQFWQLDSPTKGGWRFNIKARYVDGKDCDQFHVDLSFDDYLDHEMEKTTAGNMSGLPNIKSVEVDQITELQQFAEKLHALSRDYVDEVNPRMRDLVDCVVIIRRGLIDIKPCAEMLKRVFDHRKAYCGYGIPNELPALHPRCEPFYDKEARQANVDTSFSDAVKIVWAYFDEIRRSI